MNDTKRTPALALTDTLWNSDEVGQYLGVSARTISERYRKKDGFPQAKHPGGGRSRWVASEVIEWAMK